MPVEAPTREHLCYGYSEKQSHFIILQILLHQRFLTTINRFSCPLEYRQNDKELDLPYIYWIPKMHKNPYKHQFIAGSSKCSTKPLSILLSKLLTQLQKYCETAYSRIGVNQIYVDPKGFKRIIRSKIEVPRDVRNSKGL